MDQTNTLPAPAAAEPSHDQIQALLDQLKFSQEKEKFLLTLPRIADIILQDGFLERWWQPG